MAGFEEDLTIRGGQMVSDLVPGRDSPDPTEIVHESGRTRVTRLFLPEGTVIRKEPLGPDAEHRVRHETAVLGRLRGVAGVAQLAGFTELAATAVANAEAQAEVSASRARIVAAADQARRRIERNLHDGAQQRLVSLGLRLRAVQASIPRQFGAQLDDAVTEAAGALDELGEIARGIHPAVLTERGLAPALKTLARRSAVLVDLHVRVELPLTPSGTART
jgi:signal transduction histidine kinase